MPSCLPSVRAALAGAALALGLAGPALAATLNVPADFPTVQDAIDAASSGDSIGISPGTYPGDFEVLGKTLEIVGLGDGPGDVVLVGSGTASVGFIRTGSSVTLRNLRITGGAVGPGGGLRITDSTFLIEEVVLAGNAGNTGGGINAADSSGVIRRSLIAGNQSDNAGGAVYFNDSGVSIEDSVIRGNESGTSTFIAAFGADVTVRRTRIHENSAPSASVLGVLVEGSIDVSNSIIDGNACLWPLSTSSLDGSISLVNVTIADNPTTELRLSSGPGAVSLLNSILDGDPSLPVASGGGATASRSLIAGGGLSGQGVIEAAPIWKAGELYQLDAGSPGIDAGDSRDVSADPDFLGLPRFVDDENVNDTGVGPPHGYLDMGAIERRPAIRYVDDSATGTGSGRSWDDAMTDLQDALDDADAGDVEEIWIAAGTYRPDRGTGDQDLSFEMRSDLQILGGFAGVETRRNDRDSWAHETVLSGEIGDPADVDDNTRVVIRAEAVAPSGVLSGVVVERGMAAALGLNSFGGGILVLSGGPTFSDVWVRECQAQPLAFGSAIFSHFSDATFRRVRVTGNGWARDGRGTVVLNGGSPTLANVQITGNRNLEDAALTLLEPEGTTIVNVTVWGNMTGGATAGVLRLLGGDLEVANSIVWGNVPENPDPDQPLAENNAVGIGAASRYTTVLGWAAFGEGNNGLNPQFVDPIGPDSVVGTPDDDLRLSPGSPVIDAGDNTALPPAAGSRDVAGVARFLDDPGTEDSGVGPGPIVDRGAHEFDGVTVSCPADVDGDGTVGFDDVLEVLAAFGPCP